MRNILILLILCVAELCFASQAAAPSAKEEPKKKPPALGNCDPYTDYYIYKCQPLKCKLPIANMPNVFREMETIGYEKNICLHNYKLIVRNPNYPPTDFKMRCRLSERGRLEMAAQFTNYKKGETDVYTNPPFNETLNQECEMY